jgi:hypothetical protein
MPDFKGPQNFYLILAFIVPGLVAVYVRSRFISGRAPTHTDNILSYLTLSLVYYAIALPFVEPALYLERPWTTRVACWLGLTIAGPSAFGLFLGAAAQKGWGRWAARKIGLTAIHVMPTAWDWRFSTTPGAGMFMMVTLNNDEQVAGFFGKHSFASSDSGERDLFLEEEYNIGEDGQWAARPETVGIFIPGKEIKYIEIWQP